MDRRQAFFQTGTVAGQVTYKNVPNLIGNQVNENLNHKKSPFHTPRQANISKSNNAKYWQWSNFSSHALIITV